MAIELSDNSRSRDIAASPGVIEVDKFQET